MWVFGQKTLAAAEMSIEPSMHEPSMHNLGETSGYELV